MSESTDLSGFDIAVLNFVQKNPFTPKVSFSKLFVFCGASVLVSGFPESEGTGLGGSSHSSQPDSIMCSAAVVKK